MRLPKKARNKTMTLHVCFVCDHVIDELLCEKYA